MKKELFIKNMVCDRCKMKVEQLLIQNKVTISNLQLGKVVLDAPDNFNLEKFDQELTKNGFELIENPDKKLVEEIKITLLSLLDQTGRNENFSDFLSDNLHKDYSVLSKTFKKNEGKTIEKYLIQLKIEKVKELIQMRELSFSEIAYQLTYHSISHLSSQFKSITGMTMSEYRESQEWNRSALDKIL